MIFSSKLNEPTESIELDGDVLQVVKSYKYLGHMINFNFKDNDDVHFRLNNFYASFNTVFRNFKSLDKQSLLFLFNAYCLPDYGLNLWNNDRTFNSQIFKTFEIAFNKALKRVCEVQSAKVVRVPVRPLNR